MIILLILLGGFLYHCGGLGRDMKDGKLIEDPWIPIYLRHSWVRDWLLPAVNLAVLFTIWHPKVNVALVIASLLSYVIQAGALSTYWDWVNEIFYLPEEDKLWFNWLLHGAGVGGAFFPLITQGLHWYAVLASSLACGFVMMVISERTTKAKVEEFGRGIVAIAATLLLIF